MRPTMICLLALVGCRGILDIPSEGRLGCPAPCMVTVKGRAVPAERVDTSQLGLENVTVRLTSVDPALEVVTDASGAYSFSDLQPDTPIAFNLSVPQRDPDVEGLLDTLYVAGTTGIKDLALDLPVVQYRWLAEVAVQCGIFKSIDEALFEPGTRNLNTYFSTRATIVGQVLGQDGSPATLDHRDLSVVIDEHINSNQNPDDDARRPTTLCFLEPDELTGTYRGVNASETTSGRFVVFRARNDLGTGTGMGEVQIPGFPAGSLNVSSGSIGFVRIQLGEGPPLPERPRTFERDVYAFFADKTCGVECHRPPEGIGYVTAPARPGPDGLTYPADWSASVDEVFDNLTKPFDTDCRLGGDTAARVCRANPRASLLYRKPSGLAPHQGVDLGTDDEMVVAVLRWIEDGAILR